MSDSDPEQRPSEPTGPIRWTQASWPATPSTAAQSTIDQMTDQLQSVIGAAERAAEAIRRDAEEQARLHLAEAQRKADRLTAERVGLISELSAVYSAVMTGPATFWKTPLTTKLPGNG